METGKDEDTLELIDAATDREWLRGECKNLASEARGLRLERALFSAAALAAEKRATELRAEADEEKRLRGMAVAAFELWRHQWTEMRDTMWAPAVAKLARVEALCDMQHDDTLIAVGDVMRALRGAP